MVRQDSAPWQREEEDAGEQFDEDAYLSGKVSILGGDGSGKPRENKGSGVH